jgi:hypothetical protein
LAVRTPQWHAHYTFYTLRAGGTAQSFSALLSAICPHRVYAAASVPYPITTPIFQACTLCAGVFSARVCATGIIQTCVVRASIIAAGFHCPRDAGRFKGGLPLQ